MVLPVRPRDAGTAGRAGRASARVHRGDIATGATTLHVEWSGSGAPVLLLHGFPQTHRMWREVAPRLSKRFTVVAADLRGYGRSGCPESDAAHTPYAKRALANDMVEAMAWLGFDRFAVVGHDRGGRVAYRMALDHPETITATAVLDVLPTSTSWDRADARLALAFWPWSLLAQPYPLPERLLAAGARAIVDDALAAWGTPPHTFSRAVRSAYVRALRDPAHAHAICEEYRAAAGIDREHDAWDRVHGRRMRCPLLALWSAKGGLATWYADAGGPLALWREWADDVRGHAIDGGHFFPEECPEQTASALEDFLIDCEGA